MSTHMEVSNGLNRYPVYRPSCPRRIWLVPTHWEVRRIRTVAELRVSNVDKHTKEEELPVRLCNYVDVYKNDRITQQLLFMAATASEDEIERFRLDQNDVVITKDSETWDDIGVPALVTEPAKDLISGYHLAILRPKEDTYGPYLFWALQSKRTAYQFHVEAKGVTRFGLAHHGIQSALIPHPPLQEQKAIVRFLDHAAEQTQRYIAGKERLIALLEEQRQALIHQAVTRGLDPNARLKPSGVEWLGDVPEHWEVRRLRHLGEAIIGLTYEPQDVRDTGLLVLRASNISGGKITFEDKVMVEKDIPNRLITRQGDILICSRSGSRALIGKNAKIDSMSEGMTFGAFMTIFRGANNDYLHQVFNSKIFEYQSGAFSTSTINQLTLGMINSIHVPFPPFKEREEITLAIEASTTTIQTAIDQARRQIDLVNEYRTRLIADVVTGQLDVRETAARLQEAPSAAPSRTELRNE